MLSVSLVLTARSLHNNMLGCLSPSGEWSWNKYEVTTQSVVHYARYTRILHSRQCCNLYIQETQLSLRDRATRACQLKSG